MALSLAACGGSDAPVVDIPALNSAALLAAVTAVDATAETVQDVADNAQARGIEIEAQDTIDSVNVLLGSDFTLDSEFDEVLAALTGFDNTDVMLSQADFDTAIADATVADNTDVMLSQADFDAAIADATVADNTDVMLSQADFDAAIDAADDDEQLLVDGLTADVDGLTTDLAVFAGNI